jgi:hypothetical protein
MADNQTPQRDQDVVSYSSFSGLRNDVTPDRFGQGDLAVANNVDLDKSGALSRRDGYSTVAAGSAHSVWSNPQGDVCYFMQGSVLKQLNADMSATTLATLKAAAPVSFIQVNGRTYFSNGVDTGVIEQGAVRSWGAAPPTLPGVQVGVGNMPAGTYQFTLTWAMNDGQESGAPGAALVQVPAGGGLLFNTLPVSADPRVVAKKLYLSPPNGEEMFLAGVFANTQTSGSYAGATTELNLPLDTQFRQAPPAGQVVAFYRGHMFVAQGDVIYPSDEFAYELFDPRRYIPADGRITMMAPIIDRELYDSGKSSGFFIGTDRSCGVLVGSTPADFQYVPKASYGAVYGAMTMVDGTMFQDGSAGMRELPMFLTTQGICVGMPDLTVKNLTRSRFSFDVGGQGAALFIPGPNRFIATSKT